MSAKTEGLCNGEVLAPHSGGLHGPCTLLSAEVAPTSIDPTNELHIGIV